GWKNWTLLSSFPEDGTPVILLGDFNLQPESSQLSNVASLLQSLALTQSPSPATHKAGNQLDLLFTRSCATSELTVTPLHVSDHFFISFSLLPTLPQLLTTKTLEDTDVLQLVTHQRATTCPLDPIPLAVLQSISEQPARPSSDQIQNRISPDSLLAVTEALTTARASSLSSVLILLHLSAAFDTVNHKLLISTLAEMGISGCKVREG
ncbi:hypothetical protein SKAU_G00380890, partial [Synaphobranchus kaupii]